MKIEDFWQVQELSEEKRVLGEAIINAMESCVIDAKELVSNNFEAGENSPYEGFNPDFDDTDSVIELTHEKINSVEKALEVDRVYFDSQMFMNNEVENYDNVSEELKKVSEDAEKIVNLVNDIEGKGFNIKHIEHSSKSLSTYLTLPMSELDRFIDEYMPDDSNFDLKDDEEYFGVRISDHESGMKFLKDQFRYIVYPNNYLNLDFNDFFTF